MSTAKLQSSLASLARLPQTGTRAAAKEVEKIAREVSGTIGPVTLGRKGRRVKLRAITRHVRGTTGSASLIVYGVPTGPWVWVTSGTGSHVIPKKKIGGKARTTRYIKGDRYAHPYGKQVIHPGATGKGAWTRVVRRAEQRAPEVMRDEVRKAVGAMR